MHSWRRKPVLENVCNSNRRLLRCRDVESCRGFHLLAFSPTCRECVTWVPTRYTILLEIQMAWPEAPPFPKSSSKEVVAPPLPAPRCARGQNLCSTTVLFCHNNRSSGYHEQPDSIDLCMVCYSICWGLDKRVKLSVTLGGGNTNTTCVSKKAAGPDKRPKHMVVAYTSVDVYALKF